MRNTKLIAFLLFVVMLFTVGCTQGGGSELPAYTEEIIENEPSTTFLPRPLANNDKKDDGSQNACVQIEQGGAATEINKLLALIDAKCDDDETSKDNVW